MKVVLILFISMLLLVPIFVFADCNKSGTTVIFINGMFTPTEDQANDAKKALEHQYDLKGKNSDVIFTLGYNASHASGLIDVVDVAVQMYQGGSLDYDLTNILRQVHTDLKTQKILLVGHSQGTFYTNAAYDYLVANGVDKNSIAVYNVGTPADRVAGNGKYLTSSTDKVIEDIARRLAEKGSAQKPLPANITFTLPEDEQNDPYGGHSFSNVYLGLAPDRTIGDIDEALNNLSANSDKDECFIQPNMGAAYWIEDTGYYFIDNVAENSNALATSPYGPEQMASIASSLFQGIYNFGQQVASDIAQIFNQNNFSGASLASAPIQNIISNSADNFLQQQSPEEIPPIETNLSAYGGIGGPDINPMEEESEQDLLDDIQEKLDILSQQVQELIAQQSAPTSDVGATIDEDETSDDENNQDQNTNQDNNQNNSQNNNQNINNTNNSGGGGGGGSITIYPKILISEVQIFPIEQRFVELYNPNSTFVDLTGWYLQRKDNNDDSWGSFVSSTNFNGKIIPSESYFLISRELVNSDILLGITLSDNNSLALKNPNGEISDKLGFGDAIDPELLPAQNPEAEQSIGRKVLTDGTEEETDNNLNDFELQVPTPKAQNITYIAPIAPIAPPSPPASSILADITAPQVSFNIEPIQTSFAFPISFTITDPLVGAVSPSGIGSYVFRWQEGMEVEPDAWQEDPATQVSGSSTIANLTRDFNDGEDGKTYNFQVQATDAAGNISEWLPETPATTKIILPLKILINEIQIEPIGRRFVELYNPNSIDIDLTDWYLQRKKQSDDSWSSFVSSPNFKDKVIAAGDYFLISRELADSDILLDIALKDSDSLALKNPEREIVDKVGWGQAQDFETAATENPPAGQSIQRKWDTTDNIPQDTDDNSADFEIQMPTPRAQNITYSASILSSDATVTSTTYMVSTLDESGAGTITNVPFGTSQAIFEAALTSVTGATLDYSDIADPVVTGNTLVITAQNGTAKAIYAITVNITATAWAQGTIDSFTTDGSFTFCTSDFIPHQYQSCSVHIGIFRDTYPSQNNGQGVGSMSCGDAYGAGGIYNMNMSGYTTPGEYDFYISYCGGNNCFGGYINNPIGNYYRTYFNGSTWTALPIDDTKVRPSSDATITSNNYSIVSPISATYTAGVLASGAGAITNIRFETSKADFETAFMPAIGATLDYSGITDPVVTGNTLVVTAQNGTTKATYIITADTIIWSQGTINSYTPAGQFSFDTSFFTDNQSLGCNLYLYQSLYPFQANGIGAGSFPCGGNYGFRPVYTSDMSSLSTVGDYTIWMSDPNPSVGLDPLVGLGHYYEMHFDGSIWSALTPVIDNEDTDTTAPSIIDYTLNNLAQSVLFNPNNSEPIIIVINTSEPVKFNHIYICPDSAATCDGSNDVKYFYQTNNYSSTVSKEWEGNASDGSVIVPDGVYKIGVQITDEAGNETNSDLAPYTITVDTTLP